MYPCAHRPPVLAGTAAEAAMKGERIMEAVHIETYEWRQEWKRECVRPVIRWLCHIAAMEVEFVPYGQGGDRVPAWFNCSQCFEGFYSSVDKANEEIVECPECGARYLTANDCSRAWILHPVV